MHTLMGKLLGKRLFGRLKIRWKGIIKMFRKLGYKAVNWMKWLLGSSPIA
jgi:hypothetical protein